jgi:hypothetical protein
MPFDGTEVTPALRRRVLADALRAQMPQGHEWEFGTYLDVHECGTAGCAIGLAHLLWPEAGLVEPDDWGGDTDDNQVAEFFGLTLEQEQTIFYSTGYEAGWNATPEMVADALEKCS